MTWEGNNKSNLLTYALTLSIRQNEMFSPLKAQVYLVLVTEATLRES